MSSLVSSSHKAALIYDGVHLFSRAVENLITETDLTTPQVGCDNKDSPYDLGDRLLKEINSVSAYLMITFDDRNGKNGNAGGGEGKFFEKW